MLVSKETDNAWRRISGFGTVFLWFVSVQYSSLSSSLAVCGFLIPLTSLGVLVLIVSLKISVRCFQTFFDSAFLRFLTRYFGFCRDLFRGTMVQGINPFVTSASIRAAHTRGLVAGPSSCTSRRFSQKKESVYTRGQSNLIFGWSIFIRSQPKSEKKHTLETSAT